MAAEKIISNHIFFDDLLMTGFVFRLSTDQKEWEIKSADNHT